MKSHWSHRRACCKNDKPDWLLLAAHYAQSRALAITEALEHRGEPAGHHSGGPQAWWRFEVDFQREWNWPTETGHTARSNATRTNIPPVHIHSVRDEHPDHVLVLH